MYRINDIQNALQHVIGWRQAYDPGKAIDEGLTESESGLYFQDAHPLLTLDNMRSIMPDDWGYQYPTWTAQLNCRAGLIVRHASEAGEYWRATADSVGMEPGPDSPYWAKYDLLSAFLEHLTRGGIATAVQTFTQIKQLTQETRNLLERKTFFDGAGRIRATTQNTGRLVGFEIVPIRAMGVTMKIEKIGLQMTGGTGTVRLYLFHSSQPTPIKTFDLDFTVKNGGFQWFTLADCYLPYMSDQTNAGGAWYLCYDQSELPFGMEAINVSKDWSREPCGTCNVGSVETWRQLTKYMQVSPFMISEPEDFRDNPELWDVARMIYTNTMNYGMNCEVSVGCDLTDFIISQRQIFQTVIQRQVAATALRMLALNPNVRVNRNQANAGRGEILYELDGDSQGRAFGLGYELRKAYEALEIDTNGLDRVCLACNNHGVRVRAI